MTKPLDEARVVVVVDDKAYRNLELSPSAHDFLDREDLAIVRHRGAGGDDEVATVLARQNLLRPGAILIQSPFNPRQFAEAGEAERRFAIDKFHSFLTFAAALGASKVEIVRIDTEESNSRMGGGAGGTHPSGVKGQASAESENATKHRSGIKLKYSGSAGPPDFTAAEKILDEKRLWGDPTMTALLDIRRLQNVEARDFELDLELSSEAKANLNLAASLSLPGLKDAFGAKFTYSGVSAVGYKMNLKVAF